MNIECLLEELDYAIFENGKEDDIISTPSQSPLNREKPGNVLHPSDEKEKENLKNLLEDLDCGTFDEDDSVSSTSGKTLPTEEEEEKPKYNLKKNTETVEKRSNLKYSEQGYEIHRKLKESRLKNNEIYRSKHSWSSNKIVERTTPATSSTIVAGKVDVYAEPTFGLRLINPLVSAQFMQTKMTGKQPVAVENIAYHLKCGDKNTDWVFAGVVIFKSPLKTSQKGSQYCVWKISDLKRDLQTVSVYLFSKACQDLWKIAIGTVVAILNATPFNKDEQISKNDLTLTVRNADQVMLLGGSRDYGICKAKKKNGENCSSFVNKSACEFCLYHVKTEYNKFSNRRTDLRSSFSDGLNRLRNKVLGKNEVFYAGQSYSALKPPSHDNNVRKRDNRLLNMLPLKSSEKCSPSSQFQNDRCEQSSDERIERRIDMKNENVKNKDISDKVEKSAKAKPTLNKSEKSYTSRLHKLKEAGQRMIETGETTRVTLVKSQKKDDFCFANIFHPSETPGLQSQVLTKTTQVKGKLSSLSSKKPYTNEDFELHVESAPSNANVKHIEVIGGSPKIQYSKKNQLSFGIELNIVPSRTSKSSTLSYQPDAREIKPTLNISNTSSVSTEYPQNSFSEENSSKIRFSNKSKKLNDTIKSNSHEKDGENCERKGLVLPLSNSPASSLIGIQSNDQTNLNLSRSRSSTINTRIHECKKKIDKMNAINLIKKQGGLVKCDPNQVKPNLERKVSLKRKFDNEREEIAEEVLNKKSILSQRFIDLMNVKSKHEDLVDIAEATEQQNYFNKLEKKEQLEEKMLSTFKVPCKAVTCLRCKYKWFSASDLCRSEGHPIKVIDAHKRFFKCENCSNRTVSLEIIPLINCKNCGSSKWSRAPMIRDKIVKSDHRLCIRGDEQKHLNSLSESVNLNLLVPE